MDNQPRFEFDSGVSDKARMIQQPKVRDTVVSVSALGELTVGNYKFPAFSKDIDPQLRTMLTRAVQRQKRIEDYADLGFSVVYITVPSKHEQLYVDAFYRVKEILDSGRIPGVYIQE